MAGVIVPGLSTAEAAERRRRGGANRLPAPKRPSVARRLLGELTHFFALLLWAAAALAFLAKLPQLSVAIVAVIVLNGIFALIERGPTGPPIDSRRCCRPASRSGATADRS